MLPPVPSPHWLVWSHPNPQTSDTWNFNQHQNPRMKSTAGPCSPEGCSVNSRDWGFAGQRGPQLTHWAWWSCARPPRDNLTPKHCSFLSVRQPLTCQPAPPLLSPHHAHGELPKYLPAPMPNQRCQNKVPDTPFKNRLKDWLQSWGGRLAMGQGHPLGEGSSFRVPSPQLGLDRRVGWSWAATTWPGWCSHHLPMLVPYPSLPRLLQEMQINSLGLPSQ